MVNTDGLKTIAAYEAIHKECWYAYTERLPHDDPRRQVPRAHASECAKDKHPDEATGDTPHPADAPADAGPEEEWI